MEQLTLQLQTVPLSENGAVGISILSGMLDIGNTILRAAASGVNLNIGKPATVTSHGYNVSSDDAGGFLTAPGDQINTDPLLGPLQDNGGPTSTHALLPGSPAIDAGNPNFTPPPFYDQRGANFGVCVTGASTWGRLKCRRERRLRQHQVPLPRLRPRLPARRSGLLWIAPMRIRKPTPFMSSPAAITTTCGPWGIMTYLEQPAFGR